MGIHEDVRLTPGYYFPASIPDALLSYVQSCKYVWEMLARQSLLFANLERSFVSHNVTLPTQVTIVGPVHIGLGTTVGSGAYIEGPVIIGEECQIGEAARIYGFSFINSNCAIGAQAEVRGSLLLPFAEVGSLASVGYSILGGHSVIGSGVITAYNYSDETTIKMPRDVGSLNTGLKSLGCIVGDKASLGATAFTEPGTLIEPEIHLVGPKRISGLITREYLQNLGS